MTHLYQLELDQTEVNCGSSYVIHLTDKRFVIIDGGYFTAGEEDRLYRFLCERSGGVPVIAAWFFSHAHQDHVGNFINFVRRYSDQVQIDKLLYSFHPVDLSAVSGDWKSSDPATIREFYKTVEEVCPDVERVSLRKGDRLVFGELIMDVLYTYEELYPTPAAFNDYSTVITTIVDGYKILWLADVAGKASSALLRDPEQLRCDMVQVAHHGIDNIDKLRELYTATEAEVALWPAPDYGMAERKDQSVNNALLYEMNIKEHLVSGYGRVRLPLPYVLGQAKKWRKCLSLEMQPDPPVDFAAGAADPLPFRYMTPLPVEPDKQDGSIL